MPLKFYLDKRENICHERTIRLSWCWKGERFQTTIGQRIKEQDWDKVRQIVKSGAHNNNGVFADDINAILKKLKSLAYAMERIACTYNKPIFDFMMSESIRDVLSDNFSFGDDIAAYWMHASEYQPDTQVKYYLHKPNKYYKRLCVAYAPLTDGDMYVIQEMFGEQRIIVEPRHEFKGKVSSDYPYDSKYWEVDEDEALGRNII